LWLAAAQGRPEESGRWAFPLRRAVWRRAFAQAPLHTVRNAYRFFFTEAVRFLQPPLPWLTILGPDGSGKSTVLAGIRDAWPQSLGQVYSYHLRPRRLGSHGGQSSEPVVDPHAQPPRGAIMSAAALMFVVLDWWIGYSTRIVRQRAKHGLVVFDRHLLDVLVDPRRYRYGGPSWLARTACRLVPRPDVIVILDASTAIVRARKQEVTSSESRRQRAAYRRLAAETSGAHLVDAAAPSEQVLEAIMTILRRQMQARSGLEAVRAPAPWPRSS
jgi:thymidylate kinase